MPTSAPIKKPSWAQRLSGLHTWAGLIAGWLLFAIFFTGTLTVFDHEITRWMRYEIPLNASDLAQSSHSALSVLSERFPESSHWHVLLPSERLGELAVVGSDGNLRTAFNDRLNVNPADASVYQRLDSLGGRFFFLFHFTLHIGGWWGICIVGFLGLLMLLGLLSGLVIHKKIFKDFFTFRPNKGQRSWLDGHNTSAVLLLPFLLVMTYSGINVFSQTYFPQAWLHANKVPAPEPLHDDPLASEPSKLLTPNPQHIAPLLQQAEQRLGPLNSLEFNRQQAILTVKPQLGNQVALGHKETMRFDWRTGAVIQEPPMHSAIERAQLVIMGLHFGQFGGYPLRWLYFFCGLLSSAMIASGLVMFTLKRRRNYAHSARWQPQGYRFIEATNIASIAGLFIACLGLLWINRLYPFDGTQRALYEMAGFFGLWALSWLHAGYRPVTRAWREQLLIAAVLCLSLPLWNVLFSTVVWGTERQWIDLALLGFAAALWLIRRNVQVNDSSPRKAVKPHKASMAESQAG